MNSALATKFSIFSLLRFAAPSIGMMIVISLYTVTDGIFIGRYAGAHALAASNIVYPAINLIFGIGIMLASGGSALVAKNLGEKKLAAANRRFTLIAIASFTLGLLLALGIYLFFDPLLRFLGASELLMQGCRDYLGTTLPFFPAAALMVLFNAFYIADGRPVVGFLVSLASGLTNAVLDYVFLAHFGMGVMGAALATGLADLLAALIGLYYFSRASLVVRFTRTYYEGAVLLKAMTNGASELVTQLSVGVTTFLFNILTFAYAGEAGIAAITVILYSEMLLNSIFMGFTNGVAPVFSYNFGARNFPELRRLLRLSLVIIGVSGIIAFSMSRVLGAPLVDLFLPEGGEVASLTLNGLYLFAFSFIIFGFNLFASGFFTALSDGRTSAILSFARNLAGIVIALLTLPHLLGIDGIWLAVPVADLCALLLSAYCIRSAVGKWSTYPTLKGATLPGSAK